MSDIPPHAPPSIEEMLDRAKLESFYKDMWEQSERVISNLIKDNASLRAQVNLQTAVAEAARTDARRSLEDSVEWRRIAIKLGSDVKTEWKNSEFAMHGKVFLSADILHRGGRQAVLAVCGDLAARLVAEREDRGLNMSRTGLSVHEGDTP